MAHNGLRGCLLAAWLLMAGFAPLALADTPVAQTEVVQASLKQRLAQAIEQGDLHTVQQLLQQGAPLDVLFNDQQTALSLALAAQQPAIAHYLLDTAPKNVLSFDSSGQRSLYYAVRLGDQAPLERIIQHLVEQAPADTALPAYNKQTACPIRLAISQGDLAATQKLYQAALEPCPELLDLALSKAQKPIAYYLLATDEASQQAVADNSHFMQQATSIGDLALFKALQAYGGKIDDAVYEATIEKGHLELLQYLLQQQPERLTDSEQANSLVRHSIRHGESFILDKLFARLDVNALRQQQQCDEDKPLALYTHLAAAYSDPGLDILKRLLEQNFPTTDPCLGNTLTHASVLKSTWRATEEILALKQPPQSLSARNHAGDTPLHLLVRQDLNSLFTLDLPKHLVSLINKQGETVLHTLIRASHEPAIESDSFSDIKKLLAQDATLLNAQDNDGETALIAAIKKLSADDPHQIKRVFFLLQAGADPKLRTHQGQNALLYWFDRENKYDDLPFDEDLLHALLDAGIDLNVQDVWGNTALHYAITRHDTLRLSSASGATEQQDAAVLSLLAENVDLNLPNNEGQTPLLRALSKPRSPWGSNKNHSMLARWLLDAGADVTLRDAQGNNALHLAAQNGHHTLIEPLLDAGVALNAHNADGDPPLHLAASPQIVQQLVARGAHLDQVNQKGQNVLQIYALEADKRLALRKIKTLLQVASQSGDSLATLRDTALHISINYSAPELTQFLLEAGASTEVSNAEGNTPLILAVRSRSPKQVKTLLAYPDSLPLRNRYGNTALLQALQMQEMGLARLLLDAGSPINTQNRDWRTPLMYAVIHNDTALVEDLLAQGADVNVASKGGWTALHFAIAQGHFGLVKRLLESGADPRLTTWKPQTVLDLSDDPKITALLQAAIQADHPVAALSGDTLLHQAIRRGNVSELDQQLQQATIAQLTQPNAYGNSPLHTTLALAMHRPELAAQMLQALLGTLCETSASQSTCQHPERLEQRNIQGETALQFAVREQLPLELVTSLLDYGAKPAVTDAYGQAAIALAAQQEPPELLKALLDAEPALAHYHTPDSRNLLHLAAEGAQLDNLRLLLARGFDPNVRSQSGARPIHFYPRLASAKLLSEFGAEWHSVDVGYRHTPLFTQAMQQERYPFATFLLQNGYDVHANLSPHAGEYQTVGWRLNRLISPLADTGEQNLPLLSQLLQQSAVQTELNSYAGHLLEDALQMDNSRFVALYMEYLNVDTDYLLHVAVIEDALQSLKLLHARGLTLNNRSRYGYTLLHTATSRGSERCLKWLIAQGLSVNALDNRGQSPLDTLVSYKTHGYQYSPEQTKERLNKQVRMAKLLRAAEPDLRYKNELLKNSLRYSAWPLAHWLLDHYYFEFTPDTEALDALFYARRWEAQSTDAVLQEGFALAERLLETGAALQTKEHLWIEVATQTANSTLAGRRWLLAQGYRLSPDEQRAVLKHLPNELNMWIADTIQLLDSTGIDFSQSLDESGNTVLHKLVSEYYPIDTEDRADTLENEQSLPEDFYTAYGLMAEQFINPHQPNKDGLSALQVVLMQSPESHDVVAQPRMLQAVLDSAAKYPPSEPVFLAGKDYLALQQPEITTQLLAIPALRDELRQTGYALLTRLVDQEHSLAALLAPLQDTNMRATATPTGFTPPVHTWLEKSACSQTPIKDCLQGLHILADQGVDLSEPDAKGRNALHRAVQLRNSELFSFLLPRLSPANAATDTGNTPLHELAQRTQLNTAEKHILQSLLKHNAPLDAANQHGDTPLMLAAKAHNQRVLQLLLQAGADPSLRNTQGRTAFMLAAQAHNRQALLALLPKVQAINAQDKQGNTAMHLIATRACTGSACQRSIALAQLLINRGANLEVHNHDGNTPLFVAAYQSNLPLMQFFAPYLPTDLQRVNRLGDSLLHIALYQRNKASSTWLITQRAALNQANANQRCPSNLLNIWQDAGSTALFTHYNPKPADACAPLQWTKAMRAQRQDPQYFYAQLQAALEPQVHALLPYQTQWRYHAAQDKNNTFLHRALQQPLFSEALIDTLIERVNLANQPNQAGQTPVSLAVARGSKAALVALQAQGGRLPDHLLHIAVQHQQLALFDYLVAQGLDLQTVDAEERTVLHRAAQQQNATSLKHLLQYPRLQALVNQLDKAGYTAAHYAALESDTAASLQALYAAGADLDQANREQQQTPLLLALSRKPSSSQYALVEWLLAQSVDIEARDAEGRSAYLYNVQHYLERAGANEAALQARLKLADLLQRNSANVNAQDKEGRSALYSAAPVYPLAMQMLQQGVDPRLRTETGETALFQAARARYNLSRPELSRFMQRLTPTPELLQQSNSDRENPLSTAVRHSNTPALLVLLELGADPSRYKPGYSPLMYIVQQRTMPAAQKQVTLDILLAQPSLDLNVGDSNGRSALQLAIIRPEYDIAVQLLAQERLDVNHGDRFSQTALHNLAQNAHKFSDSQMQTLLQHLFAQGVDVDARDDNGRTALLMAVEEQEVVLVKSLLEAGANFRLRANNDRNPLYHATRRQNLALVEALLKAGADPQKSAILQESALTRAREYEWEAGIELMQRYSDL